MLKPVYLLMPLRTPIGRFGGAMSALKAPDLGVSVVTAVLERSGLPADRVDELIFGNGRQAGVGPNVARQILYRSGIPVTVPAYTVNKACGSGLQSIVNGAQSIQLDEASCVVAGGTESMSNTPYLLPGARWGYRLGHNKVVDGMYQDGFLCPLCSQLMGDTAENVARDYKISREEQDQYAVQTQQLCQEAREAGRFLDELVPVEVPSKKGPQLVQEDEHPRAGVTVEKMAKLPPVFEKDGTVHAGNASGITDGAAALIVANEATASELGGEPVCRLLDYVSVGVEPSIMGIGPVPAVQKILERNQLKMEDIDLVELNEAFAAQVLACVRDLEIPPEKINVNGGAIALGHPIGCTGTRIVVTLMHEMRRRQARYGIATLCISGGMGMALLLENEAK